MATAQEYYSSQARLTFRTPAQVKALFSALEKMAKEVTLDLAEQGLTARFMDASHIALVDLYLPLESVEKYEFSGSKPLKVGLNLKEVNKALKEPGKREAVTLTFTEKALEIKGEKSAKKINTVEAGAGNCPLPKLVYNTSMILSTQLFDSLLSDIQVMSENVQITSNFINKAEFFGKGDPGEARAIIERGLTEGFNDMKLIAESAATFSIYWLLPFNRAMMKGFPAVTVEYSTKMPVRLEYLIPGGGRLHYYLAPRVHDPTDINEARQEAAKANEVAHQEPPKSTETTNEPAEITAAEIAEHDKEQESRQAEDEILAEARDEDLMNGKEPIQEPVKPAKRQARKPKKAPIEPPKGEKWYFTVDGSIKAKNEVVALGILQELFDPLQEKLIVGLACPAVKDDRFTVTGTLIAENETSAQELVQKVFTGLVEQKIIRLKSPSVTSERELLALEAKEQVQNLAKK